MDLTHRSRAAYVADQARAASAILAAYTMIERHAPHEWSLARGDAGSRIYLTYTRGKLLVHGDCPAVLFAFGPDEPRAALRFFAETTPDEAIGHAERGTCMVLREVAPTLLAAHLLGFAAERVEENVCDWHCDAFDSPERGDPHYAADTACLTLLAFFARLLVELDGDDAYVADLGTAVASIVANEASADSVLVALINDHDLDGEDVYAATQVPAERVLIGRAALRRAHGLLGGFAESSPTGRF